MGDYPSTRRGHPRGLRRSHPTSRGGSNAAATSNPTQDRHDTPPTTTSPANLDSEGAQNIGNTRGRGGGRGARPLPTKTLDPAKAQRKIEHAQRMEQAAATRKEEGAAREAARFAESLEPPATNTPTPAQQGLPPIIPPPPPTTYPTHPNPYRPTGSNP